MMLRLSLLVVGIIAVSVVVVVHGIDYGVDCSWPILHKDLKGCPSFGGGSAENLFGNRKQFYHNFMDGCRKKYAPKGKFCDRIEDDRLMTLNRQVQSIKNYTDNGYKKVRTPEKLMKVLNGYWEKNKDNKEEEEWPTGNIYANHWDSPTYLLPLSDDNVEASSSTTLRGGSNANFSSTLYEATKSMVEEWTGMEMTPIQYFGFRTYTNGAIEVPHVDHLPLVSSVYINVAQDIDEDWPMEVYDHKGRAHNITLEPGDMLLYESGSLIMGRPFPMKGKYVTYLQVHYEPTGKPMNIQDDDEEYKKELDDFLPPYIIPNSPQVEYFKLGHPHGWKGETLTWEEMNVPPDAHIAAQEGNVKKLSELYIKDSSLLTEHDRNGWQPIHEAARSGQKNAIEILLNFGADINARTHEGHGESPLNIAIENLGTDHEVVKYLNTLGALDIEYGEGEDEL